MLNLGKYEDPDANSSIQAFVTLLHRFACHTHTAVQPDCVGPKAAQDMNSRARLKLTWLGYLQGLVQIPESKPELSSMQGASVLSGAAYVIHSILDGVVEKQDDLKRQTSCLQSNLSFAPTWSPAFFVGAIRACYHQSVEAMTWALHKWLSARGSTLGSAGRGTRQAQAQ
jgi:hypothetical protein